MYLTLYMCLHLVGFCTIYLLPRFIRGEKRTTPAEDKKSNGISIEANGSICKEQTIATVASNGTVGKTIVADDNNKTCDNPIVANGTPTESKQANNLDRIDSIFLQNGPSNGNNAGPKTQLTKDNLSHLIRKKIDNETRNLEDFFDKSVRTGITGINDLKDDLMRVGNDERFVASSGGEGLRKRNHSEHAADAVDAFLKREIHSAVNQVHVLPAVLSNGHGAD